MTEVYRRLGVPPLVNAAGRYTKFGGSVMAPEVVAAMTEAARTHVDLELLQQRVGERLAELTHNEAAFVTTGAAAGIVLALMACATGADETAVRRMTEGRQRRGQVIVQRSQAIPYLPAIRLAGMEVVEVGHLFGSDAHDISAAVTEDTVAILHVAGWNVARGSMGLSDLVAVAGEHELPVLVDAAAQLPPVENMWELTGAGAVAAVFSGGKDLEGPQASGLVVGRSTLVEAIRLHSAPRQRLARALKTGKEEMVGLLAAVERYVHLDHDRRRRDWDRLLAEWSEGLAVVADRVSTARDERNEAGQPLPRLLVSWQDGPRAAELVASLLAGERPLAVAPVAERTIGLTPECVVGDEATQVVELLVAELSRAIPARGEEQPRS